MLRRKWVLDIDMLEKIAKDEVIRGYFSDEDSSVADQMRYSTIKMDLQMSNLQPSPKRAPSPDHR